MRPDRYQKETEKNLPKNRVMCPDCGKSKQLFETERKANDFIKWNGDSIEHGESLRAYYCPSCCGWHISHQKYRPMYDRNTDRLLDAYERTVGKPKKLDKLIHYDLYERELRSLEERATNIYNDIPEEIKAQLQKSAIKRFLDVYFPSNGIDDKSGSLRGMVYKVFYKDMYKRANKEVV